MTPYVISLDAEHMPSAIVELGHYDENRATKLKVDVKRWTTAWDSLNVYFRFVRSGEQSSYIEQAQLDGNYATYELTSTDMAIVGDGMLEIIGISGDNAVASATVMTHVSERMGGVDSGDTPPEPTQGWVEQTLEAAASAAEYADAAERSAQAAYISEGNASASEASALSYEQEAEGYASAAERAATSVSESAEQIETNRRDISTLTGVVGDENSGLVKAVDDIETAMDDKVGNTDYATSTNGGVFKLGNGVTIGSTGVIRAMVRTDSDYEGDGTNLFVGKGTLENLLDAGYIQREIDIQSLVTALNSAITGTISATYDTTNKKWVFSYSQ